MKYKKLLIELFIFLTVTFFNFHIPNCFDDLNKFTQEKMIANLYSKELIILYPDNKIKMASKNQIPTILRLVSKNSINDTYIFDFDINKSSSFLYSKAKPRCVYTFSITKDATEIFDKYGIKYVSDRIRDDEEKTDIEKHIKKINDYKEAYNILLKYYSKKTN